MGLINRRNFLKVGLGAAAGLGLQLGGARIIRADEGQSKDLRWTFLVDTHKCVGCGMCVKACKTENEIPLDIPASRTWVERYVVMKDGKVHADSPDAALHGFTSPGIVKGAHHEPVVPDPAQVAKTFFVPKLCNQCSSPACVQVCPVGATYQTASGVVLVDRSWCIGCGYCIMACPYGVRFFNPLTRTAEKCNWCYHRISNGMKPACVDACAFGARQIGNIKDFDDPVTRVIKTQRVSVLKEEYGTGPMTYYLGLDTNVR